MVKSSAAKTAGSLKKSELLAVLSNRSTTSRDKNRAVKLLKKFDPIPHKDMDTSFETKSVRITKYDQLQAYVCYRCDKVKQTNIKVHWNTPSGPKVICNTCYSNLTTMQELDRARKDNFILSKASK